MYNQHGQGNPKGDRVVAKQLMGGSWQLIGFLAPPCVFMSLVSCCRVYRYCVLGVIVDVPTGWQLWVMRWDEINEFGTAGGEIMRERERATQGGA